MIRRPPRSTRTDTRFPYTTLFRSQVAVVGERASGLGNLVLRQHQLERGVVADGVGRAQQGAQFIAAGGERNLHRVAPVAQLRQRLLLPGKPGLGLAQAARGRADLLVALAQLPAGVRSEERRGGEECVSTCRSRWSPYNYKQKQ